MIDRHVGTRLEAEAEQLARRIEGSRDHLLELQIRLDRALIEIELRLAPLLGVIAPVPGGGFEIAALGLHDLLQFVAFMRGDAHRRLPHRLQQVERGLRRLRHHVVEAILGKAFITQELRALGAQPHHFGSDRAIVGRAVMLPAREPCAPRRLAQIAPLRELQERLDAGAQERDDMLAFEPALRGRFRRGAHEKIRQPREIVLALQHEHVGLFIGQHILAEGRAECRQPLVDFGKPLLLVRPEIGAAPHKACVIAFEHARFLLRKIELVAPLEQFADAVEQFFVQHDLVAVPRHDRRDVALDLLERVVGVGGGQIVEDRGDAIELASGQFQRPNDIAEARLVGIAGDRVDLRFVLGDTLIEGRPEMRGLDRVKRRRLEGRGPFLEKWILFGQF
jgi:hypothetical protein